MLPPLELTHAYITGHGCERNESLRKITKAWEIHGEIGVRRGMLFQKPNKKQITLMNKLCKLYVRIFFAHDQFAMGDPTHCNF